MPLQGTYATHSLDNAVSNELMRNVLHAVGYLKVYERLVYY